MRFNGWLDGKSFINQGLQLGFFFALNGEFPLAMFDYRGVPPKIDRMCVYVVGCDSVRVKSCVVKSGHGFIYPFIRIPIL
jgi:hypothetical protein